MLYYVYGLTRVFDAHHCSTRHCAKVTDMGRASVPFTCLAAPALRSLLCGITFYAILWQALPPRGLLQDRQVPQVRAWYCCRLVMHMGPIESAMSSPLQSSSGQGGGNNHAVLSSRTCRKLLVRIIVA